VLVLLALTGTFVVHPAPAQAVETTSGQHAPSDAGFGEQWDLLNTGQFFGYPWR